jgi:cystathionine beta-lyase/cystathionine gamma-synthase
MSQVFTFGSTKMPYFALMLTAEKPVHLYLAAGEEEPFCASQLERLAVLGCHLTTHRGAPVADDAAIVVSTHHVTADTFSIVDAIVQPNVLFINNLEHISSAKILTHRKRMSTPITTPAGLRMLQKLAGIRYPQEDTLRASQEGIDDFYAHLQVMSGTDRNPASYPVAFTAGLSAICAMYMSLIAEGGVDVLMASTSYGGSSELTDILSTRTDKFHKSTFDITGNNDISTAIQTGLRTLAADPTRLQPTTLLFVEIPTNPDMKIPDMETLAAMLVEYGKTTGKEVVLMVDATFAPGSQVMRKISAIEPSLTTMVFISLSKSVSRGLTTGGTIVAGPSARSAELLEVVRATSLMLDTHARPDQLYFLARNHAGVEERCGNAYMVARAVGDALCAAVRTYCDGYEMGLNFVTPAQAASGFTSSTYSFNLPPYPSGREGENAALAQTFTTLLEDHPEFKPCVSFGQDNGLVYATVPATSTQGAIKEEDKAKQAVGGVQLCRLSFPPTCDVEKLCSIVTASVAACYAAK